MSNSPVTLDRISYWILSAITCLALAMWIRIGDIIEFENWSYETDVVPQFTQRVSWTYFVTALAAFAFLNVASRLSARFMVDQVRRAQGRANIADDPISLAKIDTLGLLLLSVFTCALFILTRPLNYPLSAPLLALLFVFLIDWIHAIFSLARARELHIISTAHPRTAGCIAFAMGLIVAILMLEATLRIFNPIEFRVRGNRLVLPYGQSVTLNMAKIPGKFDQIVVHQRNHLGFRGGTSHRVV